MHNPQVAALISAAILLCSCSKGAAERVEVVNIAGQTESQDSELVLIHKSAIAVAIPRNRLQPQFVEMRSIQDGRIVSDSFTANISTSLSNSKELLDVKIWCILDMTEDAFRKSRDRNLASIQERINEGFTKHAIPGSRYGAILPSHPRTNVFNLYKIGEDDGRWSGVCSGDDTTGVLCGVYPEYKGLACEYIYEFTTFADTDYIIEQAESFLDDALAKGEALKNEE